MKKGVYNNTPIENVVNTLLHISAGALALLRTIYCLRAVSLVVSLYMIHEKLFYIIYLINIFYCLTSYCICRIKRMKKTIMRTVKFLRPDSNQIFIHFQKNSVAKCRFLLDPFAFQ